MRKINFIADSRDNLKKFPKEVQKEIGTALQYQQYNVDVASVKPLKGFNGKVREIRSSFDKNAYRVVFTVGIGEYIYVLHAFQKKSNTRIATPKKDINKTEERLKKLLQELK